MHLSHLLLLLLLACPLAVLAAPESSASEVSTVRVLQNEDSSAYYEESAAQPSKQTPNPSSSNLTSDNAQVTPSTQTADAADMATSENRPLSLYSERESFASSLSPPGEEIEDDVNFSLMNAAHEKIQAVKYLLGANQVHHRLHKEREHAFARCTYKGVQYASGQSVPVEEQPCLSCTCRMAILQCYLRVCPPIVSLDKRQQAGNPHRCQVSKRPDQCCPTVKCEADRVAVASGNSTAPKDEEIATASTSVSNRRHSNAADASPAKAADVTSPAAAAAAVAPGDRLNSPVTTTTTPDQQLRLATTSVGNANRSLNEIQPTQDSREAPRDSMLLITSNPNGHKRPSAAPMTPTNAIMTTTGVNLTHNPHGDESSSASTGSRNSQALVEALMETVYSSAAQLNGLDVQGSCMVNGSLYVEGSAVIAEAGNSFCQYCYCIRQKIMCVRPKCHLSISGCVPKYSSQYACCPTSYTCANSPAQTNLGDQLSAGYSPATVGVSSAATARLSSMVESLTRDLERNHNDRALSSVQRRSGLSAAFMALANSLNASEDSSSAGEPSVQVEPTTPQPTSADDPKRPETSPLAVAEQQTERMISSSNQQQPSISTPSTTRAKNVNATSMTPTPSGGDDADKGGGGNDREDNAKLTARSSSQPPVDAVGESRSAAGSRDNSEDNNNYNNNNDDQAADEPTGQRRTSSPTPQVSDFLEPMNKLGPHVSSPTAPAGCVENGRQYAIGEQIPTLESCKHCYCGLDGMKECRMVECSLKVAHDCRPITPDGHCCPMRFECPSRGDGEATAGALSTRIAMQRYRSEATEDARSREASAIRQSGPITQCQTADGSSECSPPAQSNSSPSLDVIPGLSELVDAPQTTSSTTTTTTTTTTTSTSTETPNTTGGEQEARGGAGAASGARNESELTLDGEFERFITQLKMKQPAANSSSVERLTMRANATVAAESRQVQTGDYHSVQAPSVELEAPARSPDLRPAEQQQQQQQPAGYSNSPPPPAVDQSAESAFVAASERLRSNPPADYSHIVVIGQRDSRSSSELPAVITDNHQPPANAFAPAEFAVHSPQTHLANESPEFRADRDAASDAVSETQSTRQQQQQADESGGNKSPLLVVFDDELTSRGATSGERAHQKAPGGSGVWEEANSGYLLGPPSDQQPVAAAVDHRAPVVVVIAATELPPKSSSSSSLEDHQPTATLSSDVSDQPPTVSGGEGAGGVFESPPPPPSPAPGAGAELTPAALSPQFQSTTGTPLGLDGERAPETVGWLRSFSGLVQSFGRRLSGVSSAGSSTQLRAEPQEAREMIPGDDHPSVVAQPNRTPTEEELATSARAANVDQTVDEQSPPPKRQQQQEQQQLSLINKLLKNMMTPHAFRPKNENTQHADGLVMRSISTSGDEAATTLPEAVAQVVSMSPPSDRRANSMISVFESAAPQVGALSFLSSGSPRAPGESTVEIVTAPAPLEPEIFSQQHILATSTQQLNDFPTSGVGSFSKRSDIPSVDSILAEVPKSLAAGSPSDVESRRRPQANARGGDTVRFSSVDSAGASSDQLATVELQPTVVHKLIPVGSFASPGSNLISLTRFENPATGGNRRPTSSSSVSNNQQQQRLTSCFDPASNRTYRPNEIIPKDDPCKTCTCVLGEELCQTLVCPERPADTCSEERRAGECCPSYLCGNARLDAQAPPQPAHLNPAARPLAARNQLVGSLSAHVGPTQRAMHVDRQPARTANAVGGQRLWSLESGLQQQAHQPALAVGQPDYRQQQQQQQQHAMQNQMMTTMMHTMQPKPLMMRTPMRTSDVLQALPSHLRFKPNLQVASNSNNNQQRIILASPSPKVQNSPSGDWSTRSHLMVPNGNNNNNRFMPGQVAGGSPMMSNQFGSQVLTHPPRPTVSSSGVDANKIAPIEGSQRINSWRQVSPPEAPASLNFIGASSGALDHHLVNQQQQQQKWHQVASPTQSIDRSAQNLWPNFGSPTRVPLVSPSLPVTSQQPAVSDEQQQQQQQPPPTVDQLRQPDKRPVDLQVSSASSSPVAPNSTTTINSTPTAASSSPTTPKTLTTTIASSLSASSSLPPRVEGDDRRERNETQELTKEPQAISGDAQTGAGATGEIAKIESVQSSSEFPKTTTSSSSTTTISTITTTTSMSPTQEATDLRSATGVSDVAASSAITDSLQSSSSYSPTTITPPIASQQPTTTTSGIPDSPASTQQPLSSPVGAAESPPSSLAVFEPSESPVDQVDDMFHVSECNIYGRLYKVGEFIKELSDACKRCTCSSTGVDCFNKCPSN